MRGKFYKHLAMVLFSLSAPHCAVVNQAIYELHSTMMTKAKLPGKRGNGRPSALG